MVRHGDEAAEVSRGSLSDVWQPDGRVSGWEGGDADDGGAGAAWDGGEGTGSAGAADAAGHADAWEAINAAPARLGPQGVASRGARQDGPVAREKHAGDSAGAPGDRVDLVEVTPPAGPAETPVGVRNPPISGRRRVGRPKGSRTNPEVMVGGGSAGIAGVEKVKTQIAMMTAARCSVAAISRGLKLSSERIKAILGQTDTQGLVEDFRRIVKAHALSESLDIAVKGMAWVNEAIDQREPKTFDLVTRGLSNMEKVWSSASGEHRQQGVQVAVVNQTSTAAEIAQLMEFLAGSAP